MYVDEMIGSYHLFTKHFGRPLARRRNRHNPITVKSIVVGPAANAIRTNITEFAVVARTNIERQDKKNSRGRLAPAAV